MNQLQGISNTIVKLIEGRPEKSILGVHLGYMLRQAFPAFSPNLYQCRNLRQFIRENIPAVRESGYSGADVRYALVITDNAQIALPIVQPLSVPPPQKVTAFDTTPLPFSPYIWKAYSNPGHPSRVAVNQDTGEVRIISSDSAPIPPWVIVPKPSTEFLREAAREFVSTLAEPLKTKFTQLLLDPKWYIQFSVEARKYGEATRWAVFRRKKLVDKYNATIRDLNVQGTALTHQRDGAKHFSSPSKHLSSPSTTNEDTVFRSLLQRLIAQLPISELRMLRLPVGVVFDALKEVNTR